jgi:hypothetical protein
MDAVAAFTWTNLQEEFAADCFSSRISLLPTWSTVGSQADGLRQYRTDDAVSTSIKLHLQCLRPMTHTKRKIVDVVGPGGKLSRCGTQGWDESCPHGLGEPTSRRCRLRR